MSRKVLAACAGLTIAASAADAQAVRFDGEWREQRFSLFSSNDYGFRGDVLTLRSDGAVSLAYTPLGPEFWPRRAVSWQWQVEQGVPPTDLRRKGGDDRNLVLYFVFLPENEARALQDAGVRRLLGRDSARVLVYVWGGAHPRGAILDSPYLGARGKTIVLRPSGNGRAGERVDLDADHVRAFGAAPGALVGLAVSGDSDDTDSRIRAAIRDLRLH